MRRESKCPDGGSSIRWSALLGGADPFLQDAFLCSAERSELLVNLFQLWQASVCFSPEFFSRGEGLPCFA